LPQKVARADTTSDTARFGRLQFMTACGCMRRDSGH
jgi:hypothetical protein